MFKDTVVPDKYNGMTVKLNQDTLTNITSINADNFSTNLAYTMPGKSLEEFKNNYLSQENGTRRNVGINRDLIKKVGSIASEMTQKIDNKHLKQSEVNNKIQENQKVRER